MKLTKQGIFDVVLTHLFDQGEPSTATDAPAGCFYRGNVQGRPLMCAVGALIPDDQYLPEMEMNSVEQLLGVNKFAHLPIMTEFSRHTELLRMIQEAHDDCFLPMEHERGDNRAMMGRWLHQMRVIAGEYRLNPSIIDALCIPDLRD